MKFLLDTNILIPLEPSAVDEFEATSGAAAEFVRLASSGPHQLYRHPASNDDFARDPNDSRRSARTRLLQKYSLLRGPPATPAEWQDAVGQPEPGSNEWVDNQLLAAVGRNAVDYLVTEDLGIHRKSRRLGIDGCVLTLGDALATLRALYIAIPSARPGVERIQAHQIDEKDPFFESFRRDYSEFDAWLRKCKKQHRLAWVVSDHEGLQALALIKADPTKVIGEDKALKLCTFKVAERARGYRYGELLLKSVFDFAFQNALSSIYVTAFEKHEALVNLFEEFGFEHAGEKEATGEWILSKALGPRANTDGLSSFSYNLRYGPAAICPHSSNFFVVPIRPEYHDALFPGLAAQTSLLHLQKPCANGIRKAYLCHSPTKKLASGDTLLFYRSKDWQAVRVIGVVEETLRSSDADTIARFVGQKTVFGVSRIAEMCKKREVLAVNFRHAFELDDRVALDRLVSNAVPKGPPNSITQTRDSG